MPSFGAIFDLTPLLTYLLRGAESFMRG